MINTDPNAVKKMMFYLFLLFVLFGGMASFKGGPILIFYGLGCIWLLWVSIYFAYINESFTRYAICAIAGFMVVVVGMGMVSIYMVVDKRFDSFMLVGALTFSPVALACFGCYLACFMSGTKMPFEVRQGRVLSSPVKVNAYTGLIAGLSTVSGSALLKYFGPNDTLFILTVLSISILVYLIFYSRNTIRGLHLLRQQEGREGIKYTFMNIEEIREMRRASWIGRFFMK